MVAMINTALLRAMGAVANLKARLSEQRGQDLLEYALLGGFIAIGFGVAAALVFTTGFFNAMVEIIGNCLDFDNTTNCGPAGV